MNNPDLVMVALVPTAELRFIRRDDGNGNARRILQQWWTSLGPDEPGCDLHGDWRDVEEVTE